MTGFRALAELELNHLHLVAPRAFLELLRAERAVGVAATEIARADFPDEVAAVFAMVGTVAALAGIVREIALPGADIERADGAWAERAEAHRRNVEDGGRVGLAAIRPADIDAERLRDRMLRRDRMMQPLVAAGIDVVLRAERPLVQSPLGALIDQRALVARKRRAVFFALEKILPDLRANLFQDEADMRGERIVPQHGVPGLDQVHGAERRQRGERHERDHNKNRRVPGEKRDQQNCRDRNDERVGNKACAQRQ